MTLVESSVNCSNWNRPFTRGKLAEETKIKLFPSSFSVGHRKHSVQHDQDGKLWGWPWWQAPLSTQDKQYWGNHVYSHKNCQLMHLSLCEWLYRCQILGNTWILLRDQLYQSCSLKFRILYGCRVKTLGSTARWENKIGFERKMTLENALWLTLTNNQIVTNFGKFAKPRE